MLSCPRHSVLLSLASLWQMGEGIFSGWKQLQIAAQCWGDACMWGWLWGAASWH